MWVVWGKYSISFLHNMDGHFSLFCSLNSPSISTDLCCHSIIYQSPIYVWICSRALFLFHWSARLSSANTTLFWLLWLYKKSWYLLFPLILFVVLLYFHLRITLSKVPWKILLKSWQALIILNYWSTGERFDISSVVFLIVNMVSLSIYLNLL